VGQARALALDIAPQPPSLTAEGKTYYSVRHGPSARIYWAEQGGDLSGVNVRFEYWCSRERPTPSCTWVARRAISKHEGSEQGFVRSNFDAARAVAYLQREGIVPEAVAPWTPQSYGLPDPLASDPMYYVSFAQATEAECDAVGSGIERAEQFSDDLRVSRQPPADEERRGPPGPHAMSYELILPDWYARRPAESEEDVMWGELRLRGYGDPILSAQISAIFEPLEQCPQFLQN
jgi:hypothetical protein